MNLFEKLKSMKILLIDDDEWVRDSLKLFFESEKCCLTPFETAEEALEALKNQKYDIIITDYFLPGMNGLDFLKYIGKSKKDTIKILITAYGSHEILDKAKELGIHSMICKPFTTDTVEMVLSRLLGTNEAEDLDEKVAE